MPYYYYDTPDGEDCFLKLWYATKKATLIGLAVSTADVILYSHTKGYVQTATRFITLTSPLVGMAATFAVSTCVLTSLRKRDDYLNYFLAGCATGSVYGAARKSGLKGFTAALALGVGAVVLKSFVVNNWLFAPPKYNQAYGDVEHYLKDWTLTKSRPRRWKLSPDEELEQNN